jgi:hypothetical protein
MSEVLRDELWRRIRSRSHWIVALTECEHDLTWPLLAALEARHAASASAPVRVDVWDMRLLGDDADTGAEADAGTVRVVAWPRAALSAEDLQAVLARARRRDPGRDPPGRPGGGAGGAPGSVARRRAGEGAGAVAAGRGGGPMTPSRLG